MSSPVMVGGRQTVFDFVKSFLEENDYPPTVRQICDGVGYSSSATVQAHLNWLRGQGLLQGEGRTLRLVKKR